MELTLVRHPHVNAPGLCYGQTDVPLASTFRSEIAACIRKIPGPARIVASPAERCQVLARALAAFHGQEVVTDPRLAELNFGSWEGVAWDDIDRTESDPWAEDPLHRAPPGGETFSQLFARTVAAASDAAPAAVLVTHAGPIRALWMHHHELDFQTVFRRQVPYATPLRLSLKQGN